MCIGALVTELASTHVEVLAFLGLIISTRGGGASLSPGSVMRFTGMTTLAVTSTAALMTTSAATTIWSVILIGLHSSCSAMLLILRGSARRYLRGLRGLNQLRLSLDFGGNRLKVI